MARFLLLYFRFLLLFSVPKWIVCFVSDISDACFIPYPNICSVFVLYVTAMVFFNVVIHFQGFFHLPKVGNIRYTNDCCLWNRNYSALSIVLFLVYCSVNYLFFSLSRISNSFSNVSIVFFFCQFFIFLCFYFFHFG